MRRVLLLSLTVVAALAGVFLLVLALDVHRWQEQVVADDALFPRLPADRGRLAALDDPPSFAGQLHGRRRGMTCATATACARFYSRDRARGVFQVPELEASRGEAQIVLTELFRTSRIRCAARTSARFSALSLWRSPPQQDVEQRVTTLEAAIAYLQETMRVDPTNEDAKFNLESALRRMRAEPPNFEAARADAGRGTTRAWRVSGTSAAATDERLFLSPEAGLVALAALLPLALLLHGERRTRKVRAVLRLDLPARTQRGCSSLASSRCWRSSGSAPCSRSSIAPRSTSRAPTPRSSS